MTATREPQPDRAPGALAQLLHHEGRLLARLRGVFRLDPEVYREIRGDVRAIPQAFAVVIGTAVLTGLGQGSLPGLFGGIAVAIVLWLAVTGLIWAVGVFWVGEAADYFRLLRCNGFAYAWFALLVGYGLPLVGPLFGWGGVLLSLASLVVATRSVLECSTREASAICALALGLPLLLIWWLIV